MRTFGFLLSNLLAICLTTSPVDAGVPSPGTHLVENAFIGSDSQTYNNCTVRPLVEGFSGQRNPLGDHGGTPGISTVSGGFLSYRGGQGNFSDALFISRPLAGLPVEYMLRLRFRRDDSHCSARTDFLLGLGNGITILVGSGSANNTGFNPGNMSPFSLTTGQFYILEVINTSTAIDLRIWQDGSCRPASPLVSDIPTITPPTEFEFIGGNFCSPGTTVDWIFIDNVDPILDTVRSGNVNSGLGTTTDILFINEQSREATVGTSQSITVTLNQPPAGGQEYVLWIWPTCDVNPIELNVGTSILGNTVNPTPIHVFGSPQPIFCLRSTLPPLQVFCSGVAELNSPAAMPWSLMRNQGLSNPGTFTFQVMAEDGGSTSADGYSVSNAVTLHVQ